MGARSDDRAVPLPQVLDCLPGPAVLIGADYRIAAANQAYREQYASGKEVIGRRCFEVSHRYAAPCDEAGETCPIALTRESGQPGRCRRHSTASHGFASSRGTPCSRASEDLDDGPRSACSRRRASRSRSASAGRPARAYAPARVVRA